jgi:hypothetical protein
VAFLAVWADQLHLSVWARLSRWDSDWFVILARHGYDSKLPPLSVLGGHSDLAFFPIYPFAMRFVHAISPLTLRQAGLIIAWTSALAAAWGIYAVAGRLYGHRVGVLAAVLWGLLPGAIVENMGYAESTMTAFAAWALYCAVTNRWLWAGTLSSLAGLTRPNGIAVAAGVGLGALAALLQCYRLRRRGEPSYVTWWRPLVGGALAPLGWFGYIAWVGTRLGRWDAYFHVQDIWGSTWDGGVATAHTLVDLLTSSKPVLFEIVVAAFVVVGSVVLFAVGVSQRQALALLGFSGLSLVIALGDSRNFVCEARFLLPAFPLLLPIAAALARVRRRVTLAVVLGCATLLSAALGGHLLMAWPHWP